MEQFSALLGRLRQQLEHDVPANGGFRRLSLPVPVSLANHLLEWLAAQPVFPQFYWRHRDGHEEAAVCGALLQFTQPQQAQTFLRTHQNARVWGLNAFDGAAYLFLPRLEIVNRDDDAHLTLNLFSENALSDDAVLASHWLDQLLTAMPIPPLKVRVDQVRHQPERAGWEAMLHEALQAIDHQQMEKVVLARSTLLTLDSPLSAPAMMNASRQVNHRCYHYMLRFDARRAFLGSSPERLYLREGRLLLTEALAGTVANHPDRQQAQALAQWLLQDGKNQHENLLVVDDICQRLQGGADAVDVLPPEVVRLRKVQHLRRRKASSTTVAMLIACNACSQLPLWLAYHARLHAILSCNMNLFPVAGMPVLPAICPLPAVSFAWHYAVHKSMSKDYVCMPVPALWRVPTPQKSGKKSKIRPLDC